MSGRVRLGIAVAGVLAIVAVGLWVAPWNAIRHGRVEPPVVDPTGLEPALARRIAEATAAVEDDPYEAETWGRLAGVLDVHDLTPPAVACYERAEALDPTDFRWPYHLGRATLIDDREQSLAHYRRALELRPDYAPIHVHLARAMTLRDDLDEARAHLGRAAALDPTMIRPHVGLAQVALARGDAAAALEHLAEARRLGGQSREVLLLLADASERQGDADAAAGYAAGAERAPVDREALPDPVRNELTAREGVTLRYRRERTGQLLRAGRLDAAIAEWEAAVRDDPGSADAHAEYGALLAQTNRLTDAIIELQLAIDLDPGQHRARNNLGTLLLRTGRTEAGLTELRASCAAMPDEAGAHFNLAMALRGLNRPDEALAAFEQVLAIDADNNRARFEAGLLLAAAGRLVEATTAFRTVIDAEPQRQSAYVNLARALEGLGRYEQAIEAYRAGVAALPDDRHLANGLAWRLATAPLESARDGAAAVAIIRPLCEATQYGDARFLDTLAAALAETGDFGGAVQSVQQAIDLTRAAPAQGTAEARDRALEALGRRLELYSQRRPYRPGGR